MKLHLGCGEELRPGWCNVDSRPLFPEGPDFWCCTLADLEKRLEDESVSTIEAHGILEWVPWREIEAILVMLGRKLQPGGLLSVRVPDAEAIARDLVEGKIDAEAAQTAFYGNQAYTEDGQRCLWTRTLLLRRLAMLGLTVERLEQDNRCLQARARRPA